MQQYGDVVLKANPSGVATMGKKAEVTVYLSGTRTRASLFADNGGAVLGNPFTANDDGSFRFCAADGDYDLFVSGAFIKTITLFDPFDATPDVWNAAQTILNNKTSASVAGEVPGLKIGVCDGTSPSWTSNPGAGDFVGLYPYIDSSAVRTRIWAFNPIVDVNAGLDATAYSAEFNINNNFGTAPDPHQVGHKIGIEVATGGTYACSSVLSSLSTTAANRFKHGIWFESIGGQAGSTLFKAAGVGNQACVVDYGVDLSMATINYQGLRIGATPATQPAAAGVRQLANGQAGIFLQRFTDSAPTGALLQVTNAANSAVLAQIDANGNVFAPSLTSTNWMQAGNYIVTAPAQSGAAGVLTIGSSTATTVGAAGGAAALPATPLGYLLAYIGSTQVKLPYYTA